MYTLEINIKNDILKDITKKIKALEGHEVKVGMFSESGKHYSDYTYVELFKYLSEGDPSKNLPPRSPLQVVAAMVPLIKSPLQKDLQKYFSMSKGSNISVDNILEDLGRFYREEVREVFGKVGPGIPPKADFTKIRSKSPYTPLIEQGDLAEKVAYRVDNHAVKEINR